MDKKTKSSGSKKNIKYALSSPSLLLYKFDLDFSLLKALYLIIAIPYNFIIYVKNNFNRDSTNNKLKQH